MSDKKRRDSDTMTDQILRLQLKHVGLKERLIDLQRHRFLNADEQIEYRTLQKLKLQNKDTLAVLLATTVGNA